MEIMQKLYIRLTFPTFSWFISISYGDIITSFTRQHYYFRSTAFLFARGLAFRTILREKSLSEL